MWRALTKTGPKKCRPEGRHSYVQALITWKQLVLRQRQKQPSKQQKRPKRLTQQQRKQRKQRKRPTQRRKQQRQQQVPLKALALQLVRLRQEPAQALQLLLSCCKQRVQRRAGLPSKVFFS
jgi:hypothetical protein